MDYRVTQPPRRPIRGGTSDPVVRDECGTEASSWSRASPGPGPSGEDLARFAHVRSSTISGQPMEYSRDGGGFRSPCCHAVGAAPQLHRSQNG